MTDLANDFRYSPQAVAQHSSRPFNFRLWLSIPLLCMVLLLIVEPAPLDFALAHWFYQPGVGFIGAKSFVLEDFLHDRAKQAVILFGVLVIVGFIASLFVQRLKPQRLTLGYLVLSLTLSTSMVAPLKVLTAVQCPWNLSEFGATETYSNLLDQRPVTDKPGRCWPGGHASSGFALLALFFALRDRRPRLARGALVFALALGTVFSVGRMLQGAHFLSHNVWTLLIDWTICALCYRWLLYRPKGIHLATLGKQ
ncbi:phosphatase PAP2 family protein [Pseudomonas sp. 5P_3.1_Bac2]|uniref:phosphatase PAP2 family protein n=1 Tax=Pseudomonas sp. 5P_3.1_Bac2 TaxID=2971617 RepID=UPI0021C61287|nr:phosphatase PAP2 family protein [Pseudomonas sp. 5P_3.1_Bac2]MCU1717113.1 phosphatase PAP2 family protein [Pseudomonas sp. 5P_3.1_Bac2]